MSSVEAALPAITNRSLPGHSTGEVRLNRGVAGPWRHRWGDGSIGEGRGPTPRPDGAMLRCRFERRDWPLSLGKKHNNKKEDEVQNQDSLLYGNPFDHNPRPQGDGQRRHRPPCRTHGRKGGLCSRRRHGGASVALKGQSNAIGGAGRVSKTPGRAHQEK